VSDINGVARIADANLVNPWGMRPANTPLWVADNNANVSTIYSGGVRGSIPKSSRWWSPFRAERRPASYLTDHDFIVHGGSASGSAKFIFDSENGEITAWSPTVHPRPRRRWSSPAQRGLQGLAIASNGQGTFIYAANFHDATVDVFDRTSRRSRCREASPTRTFLPVCAI